MFVFLLNSSVIIVKFRTPSLFELRERDFALGYFSCANGFTPITFCLGERNESTGCFTYFLALLEKKKPNM